MDFDGWILMFGFQWLDFDGVWVSVVGSGGGGGVVVIELFLLWVCWVTGFFFFFFFFFLIQVFGSNGILVGSGGVVGMVVVLW